MIDLHSHIIHNIDDGSESLEESLSLLKKMKKIGFDIVVATPHYIAGTSFTADNKKKSAHLKQIKEVIAKEQVDINVCVGNEIFIDPDIPEFLEENKIVTINKTKYILVEFPRNTQVYHLMDILFTLRDLGYIPIIAHPERYLFIQEDYLIIDQLLGMGCLLQGNLTNILGKYGKSAEKVFRYMLKNRKYQFLASDVHHENDVLFKHFPKVKTGIMRLIGEEEFNRLTLENPSKVLKNENIIITEVSPTSSKKIKIWK